MAGRISATIFTFGSVISAAWAVPIDNGEDPSKGGGAPPARKVAIAPGTVINDRIPRTWSHVVLKASPRLASGDLGTLPSSASRTAGLFRTVILADVGRSKADPQRFALRRVGVGLCVPEPKRGEVVVDAESAEDVGVSLGMIERTVLRTAETEVNRGRLVAATSTFALYRGPAILQVGDEHHKVIVSYAFLVDENNGALRVLAWGDDLEAAKGGGPSLLPMVELAPSLSFDCRLNVKADRLLGAVPVSWSFAMEALPQGEPRPISPELARALARSKTPPDAELLEAAFRRSIPVSERRTTSHGSSATRGGARGSGPGRSARTSSEGSVPLGTTPRAR